MASYSIPGLGNYYVTKSGNFMFNIYYSNTDYIDINADCIGIDPLDIPLEVDPSGQQFRYSSLKIKFKYHAELEAMLNDIKAQGKTEDTFIDIYLNGNLYWRGILIWENIQKEDFYIDGSTLYYKTLTLDFIDAIAYLAWKNFILADASYSDGLTLKALLTNIFGLIGFTNSNISIDTNLKITEEDGNTYTLENLKIDGLSDTMLCTDFLKAFMLDFAAFIYNLNGNINIVKRNGGTTLSVSNSDIVRLSKMGLNQIKYVNIYMNLSLDDNWPVYGISFTKNQGTKNETKPQFNFERECNLLKRCYIDGTGEQYPNPAQYPSSGNDHELIDIETDFIYNLIETGDVLIYNNIEKEAVIALVVKGITQNKITFKCTNNESEIVDTGKLYWVEKGYSFAWNKRFKGELLTYMAGNTYIDYFLKSPDIYNIFIKDISTYGDISKRFVFNSTNYRARNALINFLENTINMEWVEVT